MSVIEEQEREIQALKLIIEKLKKELSVQGVKQEQVPQQQSGFIPEAPPLPVVQPASNIPPAPALDSGIPPPPPLPPADFVVKKV